MPRGSGESTGGETLSTGGVEGYQMSGLFSNTGKTTFQKTYYTSDQKTLSNADPIKSGDINYKPTQISFRNVGGGMFEKTVTYEAAVANGPNAGIVEKRGSVAGTFELEVQDNLIPIEAHPNLTKLMEKYYGYYEGGKLTFYPTIPSDSANGLGAGAGSAKKNPMFGRKYYNAPSAIFRHTQQVDEIPADIWNDTGKRIANLPANFPDIPDFTYSQGDASVKFSWIVQSPSIYRRGNAYEIVRTYKLDNSVPDELHPLTTAKNK